MADPEEGYFSQLGKNIVPSGKQFVGDTLYPFMNPGKTLDAMKQLTLGIASKISPYDNEEAEAVADALGEYFGDRYGSVDAVKETMRDDPVGFAADLSSVLTLGGGAAARVPGAMGKVGKVASKMGRVVDPIMAPANAIRGVRAIPKVGAVADIPAAVTKSAFGTTTGVGSRAIGEAFDAGKTGGVAQSAFRTGMKGSDDLNVIMKPVRLAKQALWKMKGDRGSAYTKAMTTFEAIQDPVDMSRTYQSLQEAAKIAFWKGEPISKEAAKTLTELNKTVNRFTRATGGVMTPADVDALKQAVNEVRKSALPGTKARAVATKVHNTIRDTLVEQVPEYAGVMQEYSDLSDMIDMMERSFKSTEKANPESSLRALSSSLRNNVNTNFGARTSMMDILTSYEPELAPMLAGQSLNDLAPRGIGRSILGVGGGTGAVSAAVLADPSYLAIAGGTAALTSPRLIGEGANLAGQATRVAPAVSAAPNALFQAGRAAQEPERSQSNQFENMSDGELMDQLMRTLSPAQRKELGL